MKNKIKHIQKETKKFVKKAGKEGKKIKKELDKALDDINNFELDLPDFEADFKINTDCDI